jgi:hypothetical protein
MVIIVILKGDTLMFTIYAYEAIIFQIFQYCKSILIPIPIGGISPSILILFNKFFFSLLITSHYL